MPKKSAGAAKSGIESERVGRLNSANNKRKAATLDPATTSTKETKRTKTQKPAKDPDEKATPFPGYIAEMTLKQAYTLQVTIQTSWETPNSRISIETLGAKLNKK